MTFRDPALQQTLAGIELCRFDVDDEQDREVCARYHLGNGVPDFAVVAPDGRVVHRWVGGRNAEQLQQELATAAKLAVPPAGDDPVALAEYHCARGDRAAVLAQVAVLARGDAEQRAQCERIGWLLCTQMAERRQWSEVEAAANDYLARGFAEHRDEALVLFGRARFAATGVVEKELQAHIDALLADVSQPFPDRPLLVRARRLLGTPDLAAEQNQSDAADAWCNRTNAAMAQLAQLGRAATPSLHLALLGDNATAAEHAATALGWMRDPADRAWLLEQLRGGPLRNPTRWQVVRALAMHKAPECLPVLVDLARTEPFVPIRAAAIDGLRSLFTQTGNCTDPAIGELLGDAVADGDLRLRSSALQTMFEVRAPMPLHVLLEAMRDARPLFADFRVRDNALWIFQQQLALDVLVDGEPTERCTAAIAEHLAEWHRSVAADLRWDATARHWIVVAPPAADPAQPRGR